MSFLLMAFALVGNPPAADPVVNASEVNVSQEADDNKVICRRETVIGSRVQKRRVCMTAKERRRLEQGTRDGIDDYIRKSTSGSAPGG